MKEQQQFDTMRRDRRLTAREILPMIRTLRERIALLDKIR